ncbi:MAG: hypothetical protein UT00_C0022G0005 [Parcubacteria group bacterium GW2011_GWA1_38_7]|nr:MAG: hypothetical protein UT00_C0022G0005 [Parcubacteria group bacterium GW2011_GWA1_38_7]
MNPNDPNQPPVTLPPIQPPVGIPAPPPPAGAPIAPAVPFSPIVINQGGSKKKFLIFAFSLLILVGGGLVGASLLSNKTSLNPISQASPQPTPLTPKDDELAGFAKGIAIGPNTVSVTKADGKFCLQYKGKIYLPQELTSEIPKVVTPPDPSVYTWYGLLNAPEDLTNQDSELFSFKASPDNQNFVFIMRWARSPQEQFEMFRFTASGVSPIKSFGLAAFEGAYWVPRISQMSIDGQFTSVHTYKCIDCTAHLPETLLFNLPQIQNINIEKVQEFEWSDAGKYSYKEAKPIACSDPAYSECYENPSNLPKKEAVFTP